MVAGSSFHLVNLNHMEVWLIKEIWNGTKNVGEEIKQSFPEAPGELNFVLLILQTIVVFLPYPPLTFLQSCELPFLCKRTSNNSIHIFRNQCNVSAICTGAGVDLKSNRMLLDGTIEMPCNKIRGFLPRWLVFRMVRAFLDNRTNDFLIKINNQ